MNPLFSASALALAMAMSMPALAESSKQATPHVAHHHAAAVPEASMIDVPASAQEAVQVVDAFGSALAKADFAKVEALLAADVIILETGGAERSRSEYLGHHAIADASFLGKAHVSLVRRRARVTGDVVWVASESEVHTTRDGNPITQLSTETMVLNQTAEGWRIAHIHWSSRTKKATAGAK